MAVLTRRGFLLTATGALGAAAVGDALLVEPTAIQVTRHDVLVPGLAPALEGLRVACLTDVHLHGVKDIGLNDYPNLKRWHDAIAARPAVQRAWGPFPA